MQGQTRTQSDFKDGLRGMACLKKKEKKREKRRERKGREGKGKGKERKKNKEEGKIIQIWFQFWIFLSLPHPRAQIYTRQRDTLSYSRGDWSHLLLGNATGQVKLLQQGECGQN